MAATPGSHVSGLSEDWGAEAELSIPCWPSLKWEVWNMNPSSLSLNLPLSLQEWGHFILHLSEHRGYPQERSKTEWHFHLAFHLSGTQHRTWQGNRSLWYLFYLSLLWHHSLLWVNFFRKDKRYRKRDRGKDTTVSKMPPVQWGLNSNLKWAYGIAGTLPNELFCWAYHGIYLLSWISVIESILKKTAAFSELLESYMQDFVGWSLCRMKSSGQVSESREGGSSDTAHSQPVGRIQAGWSWAPVMALESSAQPRICSKSRCTSSSVHPQKTEFPYRHVQVPSSLHFPVLFHVFYHQVPTKAGVLVC